MPVDASVIRAYETGDDLHALTDLIHAGYASQAQAGLRYWGTHQSVDDTRSRFASGLGLVAQRDGRYIGTILVKPPQPDSIVQIYRDPHTWSIAQYAVHPDFKGRGVGRELHERAVQLARSCGARTMALDTAAPAERLIAMYRRWGYEAVGEVDWRPDTNYVSVVMRKDLPVLHPST